MAVSSVSFSAPQGWNWLEWEGDSMTITPELRSALEQMDSMLLDELRCFLAGCLFKVVPKNRKRRVVKLYEEFYEPFIVDDIKEHRQAELASVAQANSLPVEPLYEPMDLERVAR